MGCFSTLLLLVGFVLTVVSFIRWVEQTTEAVDNGWWNKVTVLLLLPFSVWFFPSTVAAGRLTPVPRHEPVRGFGKAPPEPKNPPASASQSATAPLQATRNQPTDVPPLSDQPPPGTPKEFLGLPKITPARPRAGPDPEKIAKLKQKMREQGMLPPEDD